MSKKNKARRSKEDGAPRSEEDALVNGLLKLLDTITIKAPANASAFAIAQHAAASTKLADTQNMASAREVVIKGANSLITRYEAQTDMLA